MNKASGESKNASELISEVADKWDTLSDSQRRNTAVGVAGIHQLSRFNALMLNYQTSIDATETSLNSYGSAMREQEKYNTSLEARLNKLSTAWYGFANTVGENGLYDGIVVATKALEMMTNAGESGLNIFNIYSATLGVLGVGLTLMSTRFSNVASAIGTLIKTKIANNALTTQATATQGRYTMAVASTDVAVRKLTISKTAYQAKLATTTATTQAATVATATLSTAMKSLMLSTGVGAVFVVAGFALEKLISRMSEATQKAEEFDSYLNKNKLALTDNKAEVDKLISSFENLSTQKDNVNWDAEKEQEYLDVQNKLGELFPSIIDYVDANGNAHIKSKEAIDREIEAVNRLIEAEKNLKIAEAEDTFKGVNKEVDRYKSKIKAFTDTRDSRFNNLSEKEIAKINLEILKLEKNIADSNAKVRHNVLEVADAYLELGQTVNSTVDKEINDALQNIDFSNLNPEELKEFSKELSNIAVAMSVAFEKKDGSGFDSANAELTKLLNTLGLIPNDTDNAIKSFEDLSKTIEEVPALTSLDESLGEVGDSADSLAKKIEDLSTKAFELKSVQEQLAGVSEHHVQSSQELLFMYEQLTSRMQGYNDQQLQDLLNKPQLTAEEKLVVQAMQQRDQVLQQLMILYPQYATLQKDAISLSAQQVEAMKQEEKANKVLLEAYKLMAEGKLNSMQIASVNQASATKKTIENIKAEINALNILIKQYENVANASLTSQQFIDKIQNGEYQPHSSSFVMPNPSEQVKNQVTELELDLSTYGSTLDGLINSIDSFTTKINTSEKKTKSSSKATKESIYITDKYKQKIEELNLAIEKQQKLQNDFPTYSASYRKAIEAEIKLQKEKLNLMNEQAAALDKQIKSGKIAQTGNVTIGDGNSKSSTTSSKKLSGWGGKITSKYGAYDSVRNGRMHTGVDIAGARGTRLDSNVAGKVVGTGNNSLSGNFVKILDDKGMTHFYGHLDKIVAKLGDVVKVGDQIGNIGNTGNSTGSHLHYQQTNSKGQTVNPIDAVNAAKNMKVTAGQANTVVSNTKQSIDDAKSALNGLYSEIENQKEAIEKLEIAIVESYLDGFENRRSVIDSHYAHEEAKLKNVNRASSQYNKTIDGMNSLLERKQKVNVEELDYIEGLIKQGGLSAKTLDDMNKRTLQLKTSIQALNNEMGQLKLDQIVDKFDDSIKKQDQVIEYESTKINELDKNSSRYTATLEKMNKHINRKIILTQEDIDKTNKLINSGKYSGEVLAQMKDRVQELTISLKDLAQEIANNNYEVVVNVRTRSNEIADDLQFEIDRSKAIQGMYKEGSADATNEINKQIKLYQQLAKQHDETRRKLQEELKQRDLLPEQIKEITEMMEDETLAYLNAQSAIDSLTKSIEETNKRLREEIANKLINAYKEYVGERRDEHIKALEAELDAEQKRHDKLKKMWQDEMDLFRKNVEERLKLIDRAEAERSYQMEIDDLESERKKVLDKINLLSMDDSHEAKSKRKKLQEQLDKIDKDLAEKRHQRDIELQKESLNDMLEQKEDDNSNREELEDERLQDAIDSINREKEYWEKHYNDLLNDERKFAQIREDIMNGHFDKVAKEFEGYIQQMQDTMPLLSDTMDGTMQSVGTSIRQNVIDNLREAINAMNEFNAMQSASNSFNDSFNPNSSKDESYNGNTSSDNLKPPTSDNSNDNKGQAYESLNRGDMQVLFGKLINDVVAPTYKANTDDRNALKNEGNRLGQLGRNNSSQIPVMSNFNSEIDKLTSAQKQQFKSFVKSNSDSILGGKYSSKFNNAIASLDTGGYMNWAGSGIDGKGGKAIIAHPEEIMLDKFDTKKLFNSLEVSDSLMQSLASMTSSFASIFKSMSPNFSTGGNGVTENYNIQFGDVNNTTQSGAKQFAQQIMTEIRLTKGGR